MGPGFGAGSYEHNAKHPTVALHIVRKNCLCPTFTGPFGNPPKETRCPSTRVALNIYPDQPDREKISSASSAQKRWGWASKISMGSIKKAKPFPNSLLQTCPNSLPVTCPAHHSSPRASAASPSFVMCHSPIWGLQVLCSAQVSVHQASDTAFKLGLISFVEVSVMRFLFSLAFMSYQAFPAADGECWDLDLAVNKPTERPLWMFSPTRQEVARNTCLKKKMKWTLSEQLFPIHTKMNDKTPKICRPRSGELM